MVEKKDKRKVKICDTINEIIEESKDEPPVIVS